MKIIVLGLLTMGLVLSANAADRSQLNDRIHSITAKFTAMQQNPATHVPADELARARGIILLDRTRGALFFGFHRGIGVALVRDESGRWSPPGFVSSAGASLGPQIGGSGDFFVILLMSRGAVEALKQPVIDFGGQASATGGGMHTGAQAMTKSSPSVLVYSQSNGLYAGATIRGGSISADKNANRVYYGRPISMDEIVFSRDVTPSLAQQDLIAKIDEFSR